MICSTRQPLNEYGAGDGTSLTLPQALKDFIYELNLGTSITRITRGYIRCQIGEIDEKVEFWEWRGEKDWQPLLVAALHFVMYRVAQSDTINEQVLEQVEELAHLSRQPLDAMRNPVVGQNPLGAVCLLAFGAAPTEKLLQLTIDELMQIAEIHLETGLPFQEVLKTLELV